MPGTFWNGKKVLISGFEGFLGSNLTLKLLSLGADIVGLDILTGRKDTLFPSKEYRKIKVIKGDVADFALVKNIFVKNRVKVVFHLAAEAIVGRSLKYPIRAFSSNIEGAWNMLEAARQAGSAIDSIVIASSDKAYGSHKELPYKEDYPLAGCHPYDVSKTCSDLIANTYFHTYKLPVAVTRCGNIYGPGDFNFSRLIPDAMRCVFSGKVLKIRSDGKFVRDYVYVEDIVNGYIRIAESLRKGRLFGEAFNLSDEKPLTVMQVLKEINKLCGNKLEYEIMNIARYEIKKQYLASAKARSILSWKPKYNFNDGLRMTLDWYRAYLGKR